MTDKAGKPLRREEVPEELTWDLTDLFQTNEEWEAEVDAIWNDFDRVRKYKGRIAEGPDVLFACIEAREALNKRFHHVYTYAELNVSTDGTNPVFQAQWSKVGSLEAALKEATSFVKVEIIELPEGLIEKYISEGTGLEKYDVHLRDVLEEKKHSLSIETEEVLAALEDVFSAPNNIYERSKSSDMTFTSTKDEDGRVLPMSFKLYENTYEPSPNKYVRRNAYDSFIQTLSQYQQTYAEVYATEIKKQVTMARLRNYDSVTDMLLEPQKVTQEMYHNQLDVILRELKPHMRSYARLKKRVLGLDSMKFCDLKAELDEEYNPKISYEEAKELILESVQILGPEYTRITKEAMEDRWVDLADNIGKSTDAFVSSPYGTHPYVLLTWSGTMQSVFTLTHELGHAVHSHFSGKHQVMINFESSYYFVEAPSTLNELLLGKHLLSKTEDNRMRRWVILQMLETYYHNFVTHLLEGELQRRVYRLAEDGTAITATVLNKEKLDILKMFWGDTVELDEGAGLTWMRQSHYYMGLYPYTYSAGLTVSTAVSEMIDQEGASAVERWLNVLEAGGSKAPLELIRQAGIDMTETEPIKRAVEYVGYLVAELEKSYTDD